MTRFSNGFYSFSDSYLKSMRKQDLINYIRTIEKNWENQLITNDIQYSNCKRLLSEERNKTIDEFVKQLKEKILEEIDDVSERQRNYEVGSEMSITCSHIMGTLRDVHHRVIDEVAEEMKKIKFDK